MSSEQSVRRILTILPCSAIAAVFIGAIVYDVSLGMDTAADLVQEIPRNPQSEGGIIAALFATLSALGYFVDRMLGGS